MNRGESRKPRRIPRDCMALPSQVICRAYSKSTKPATEVYKEIISRFFPLVKSLVLHNVVNRESKTAVVKCMTFKLTNHLLQLKPESLTFGFAFILFVCYLTGYHRLSQPKNLTSTFWMRKLLRVSVSLQILNLFARCRSC